MEKLSPRREFIKNTSFFGMDGGTYNTAISKYEDTGRPKPIPAADGQPFTRSCVYVGPGLKEILVGGPAYSMLKVEPERVVQLFKPYIGTDHVFFEESGEKITAGWCYTKILVHAGDLVRAKFGDPKSATHVVVTIPASFDQIKRQAVSKCIKDAGLIELAIIHEPVAAALAYGVSESSGDCLAIVLDLGAWTFDISVVKYQNAQATVLGGYGENTGSMFIDNLIMDNWVVPGFEEKHKIKLTKEDYPAGWYSCLDEVIRVKHQLSDIEELKLIVSVDGKSFKVPVTRAGFDKLIGTLVEKWEKAVLKAIKKAAIRKEAITKVIVVGGASRTPAFLAMLRRLFDPSIIKHGVVSPDTAISEGAVMRAAIEMAKGGAQLVDASGVDSIPNPDIGAMKDCVTIPMGIISNARSTREQKFSPIIEANTPYPCERSEMFSSVTNDQKIFHFQVVQGLPEQALKDYTILAQKDIELPPRDCSVPSIKVTFAYDSSQKGVVRITDMITGKEYDITMQYFDQVPTPKEK